MPNNHTAETYLRKLVQEQNMMLANERIASVANTEAQWLAANKSLFVSSRRVDFFKILSRNSDRNGSGIDPPEIPYIDPRSPRLATVFLKITLPMVWVEGLRNASSVHAEKTIKKAASGTSYYAFFEAIYRNDMKDSEAQLMDINKCNISTFNLTLENCTVDTSVELNMYVWSFTPSDFKKVKTSTRHSVSNNTGSTLTRAYNFVKFASISFTLKDAVRMPYIETMKAHLNQIGLINFMDYSNFVSVEATPYPTCVKYADIHPYAVYLNENLKCYIGFKGEFLFLYPNKFSDEPLTQVSFNLAEIAKCRFDSKNKQVVKIKYQSSTHAFHLQTEEIAKIIVYKIETFIEARNEWGPSISDFNKTDLRSILADIEKIPTTYMEYIDKNVDNFSNQYDTRKSTL